MLSELEELAQAKALSPELRTCSTVLSIGPVLAFELRERLMIMSPAERDNRDQL